MAAHNCRRDEACQVCPEKSCSIGPGADARQNSTSALTVAMQPASLHRALQPMKAVKQAATNSTSCPTAHPIASRALSYGTKAERRNPQVSQISVRS